MQQRRVLGFVLLWLSQFLDRAHAGVRLRQRSVAAKHRFSLLSQEKDVEPPSVDHTALKPSCIDVKSMNNYDATGANRDNLGRTAYTKPAIGARNGLMTSEFCHCFCSAHRTVHFALHKGTDCYCFDKLVESELTPRHSYARELDAHANKPPEKCNVACPGRSSESCGGTGSHFTVYDNHVWPIAKDGPAACGDPAEYAEAAMAPTALTEKKEPATTEKKESGAYFRAEHPQWSGIVVLDSDGRASKKVGSLRTNGEFSAKPGTTKIGSWRLSGHLLTLQWEGASSSESVYTTDKGQTFLNSEDLELDVASDGLPTWWTRQFGKHLERWLLTGHSTKGSIGSQGLQLPISESSEVPPAQRCGHFAGDGQGRAWWGVDLGSVQSVREVILHNQNEAHPERLQGVDLFLGSHWDSFSDNAKIAQGITVGKNSPLPVAISSKVGQFLFVAKESGPLSLCKIAVVVEIVEGLREEIFYFPLSASMPGFRKIAFATGHQGDVDRAVASVNYAASTLAWPGLKQTTMFAARWSGYIVILTSGDYIFSLTSDDGSRLRINAVLVVDNGGEHSSKTVEGQKELGSAQHLIGIEYFQNVGSSCMQLKYKGSDTLDKLIVVPDRVLKAPGHPTRSDSSVTEGWTEEIFYFDQDDTSTRALATAFDQRLPDMVRTVPSVNYYNMFKPGQLWSGFTRVRDFAVRWSTRMFFQTPGVYTFSIKSAGGSVFLLDHEEVVKNGGPHQLETKQGKKTITRRGRHRFRVDYFNEKEQAACVFKYKGPDTGNEWALVSMGASSSHNSQFTLRAVNLDYDKLVKNKGLADQLKRRLERGLMDGISLSPKAKATFSKGPVKGYAVATVRLTPPSDVTDVLWQRSLKSFKREGLFMIGRIVNKIPDIYLAASGAVELEEFMLTSSVLR